MMLQIEMGGELRQIELTQGEDGQYHASIDGEPELSVSAEMLRPGVLSLHIDGKSYRCVLEESPEGTVLHMGGKRLPYRLDDPRSLKSRRSRHGGAEGPKPVSAPMPGRVVRLLANVGDMVEAHQGIVVIEAMKMQNELKSPKAGKVVQLRVEAGETVAAGDVLAVIE
ncbi:biotin/lipoyl-binding protein [Alloacidobacterium dinghuense]|uniref:Biotin/lipoyl-binding protein n=1 Tax=Alloacidobacterium dinghuense TaxID=2763107 RepID=A0A7G8BG16_9BACT|nr:acetyl-CoA carboxylase biotin carboxyl carrier protein subunit [Alloacidobacterium dinghuense]QNI31486.1 biotin/lipoyl-binding protein [Alloacidobacterium dinghuense]